MNRKNRKYTVYFIIMALLVIGVIYAILQANLQINGTAKIQANTWDIHFDNIQVNEDSVAIGENDSQATIDPENNCKVDFVVTLSTPGDFYEFTVDVVNAGTIDAMIGNINTTLKVNGVDSEIPDYLDYTISYSNDALLESKHMLNHNSTETYKVRLEYKTDIEELPGADTLIMSLEAVYIQADDTAIIVPYTLYSVFKTEVDNNSGLVHEYTDSHKDSFTQPGTEKIYHWYADNNTSATLIKNKWNVLFGGFCWQMWRTTDTGGVKLIYNGTPDPLYGDYFVSTETYESENPDNAFTFDSTDSTWNYPAKDYLPHSFVFKVPGGNDYSVVVSAETGSTCGGSVYINKNGVQVNGNSGGGGATFNINHNFGSLSSSDKISVVLNSSADASCIINMKIYMQKGTTKLQKKDYQLSVLRETGKFSCTKTSTNVQIDRASFYTNINSLAHVGYMIPESSKNKSYTNSAADTGSIFGNGVLYDGSNYTLTDTNSTMNTTHRYTCNNSTGVCSTVRYYYYVNSVYNSNTGTSSLVTLYIELDGEKNIEEAYSNMLSRNVDNSKIKTIIDTWYQNNLTAYTSKLEDTIFCNDRSATNYSDSGWNPSGKQHYNLSFRSSSSNMKDLSCPNVTDQFCLSNASAQLIYPVGLITYSEANLLNNDILRRTSQDYWTASPNIYDNYPSLIRFVHEDGSLSNSYNYTTKGVRPVVSLKPGTMVASGDGSSNDPYVIE